MTEEQFREYVVGTLERAYGPLQIQVCKVLFVFTAETCARKRMNAYRQVEQHVAHAAEDGLIRLCVCEDEQEGANSISR